VVHLDTLYWRPGWVEPSQQEWREQVRQAVQPEAWVIDGNYSATMDLRFERADTVIFLDFPRRICLYRELKRSIRNRGRVRSDCAPGCQERVEWHFLKWVWSYPAKRRPAMVQRLDNVRSTVRVVQLRNGREMETFLAGLRVEG